MTILKCSLFFYQFVYLPPFERLFIEVSGIHSLERKVFVLLLVVAARSLPALFVRDSRLFE